MSKKVKVYTVINQKGGVGKSTTAMTLGAGMKLRGSEVLYIDMDPQGNLSFTLGVNTNTGGTMKILQYPETITEEVQSTKYGDVIASNPALSGADALIKNIGKEYRLKEALEPIKDNYDYIIIDTPPALGILTVNALTASDKAIIPAQADIYSLQGIAQLNETVKAVKSYCNPNLSIMGILLTRYNGRAIISKDITEALKETAEQMGTILFDTKIRECTAMKESQVLKRSIFDYEKNSNAASDYEDLLQEIENIETGAE